MSYVYLIMIPFLLLNFTYHYITNFHIGAFHFLFGISNSLVGLILLKTTSNPLIDKFVLFVLFCFSYIGLSYFSYRLFFHEVSLDSFSLG